MGTSALAHPGYAAPGDRQGGPDVDLYALACIALGRACPVDN